MIASYPNIAFSVVALRTDKKCLKISSELPGCITIIWSIKKGRNYYYTPRRSNLGALQTADGIEQLQEHLQPKKTAL